MSDTDAVDGPEDTGDAAPGEDVQVAQDAASGTADDTADDAADDAGPDAAPEQEPGARSGAAPDAGPGHGADVPATAGAHDAPGPDATAPAHRPRLVRTVLTSTTSDVAGTPTVDEAHRLAAEGHYVLLAVPAETPAVTSELLDTPAAGVVRLLSVPVDPDHATALSAARVKADALQGTGLTARVRRRRARRDLESLRARAAADTAADPDAWAVRCADAYRPYLEAFSAGTPAEAQAGTAVAIGPTNTSGQAHAWAGALVRNLPGVHAEATALASLNTSGHPADHSVSTDEWLSTAWQLGRVGRLTDAFTHVLAEAAMAPFGRLNGPWLAGDLAELKAAGVAAAVVLHGPEIRDPAAHRARMPFSPFDPRHDLTVALQTKVDRLAPVLRDLDVPMFVVTPDLLADVPGATWLPVVVDPDLWATDAPLLRRDRPVVVHVGNSPFTDNTEEIEPAAQALHDVGLIEYRRLRGLRQAQLPQALADADIVLDQFALGTYGMPSVLAMAAGRVAVCHVHESVAAELPDDLPVVGAEPGEVGEVLERLVAEREDAKAVAARGPAYVREHHDGRRSARALAPFLGIEVV